MGAFVQKKVAITHEHKQFIENYKKWRFSDQSSSIREALNLFIREFEANKLEALMTQKAH